MFFPIRTDSPLRRTPWMNWALIAANIVMYMVQRVVWRGDHLPWALNARNPQLWQYFTYQFLHADILHIGGNMLFLYIFGNNVNDRMGNWGYLAFYLAGGVAAGAGYVLTSSGPVIGASGSISAVTGAYLALLPRSHITIVYFFFLIGVIEIPSIYFIIASFVLEFIYGFSSGDEVAHTAHVAGSVFGFAISFALLAVGLLPRDQFDLFALFQRWNRRRQYTDLVSKGYNPFGAMSSSSGPANPNMERIQDLRAQISEEIAHQKIENAVKYYLELHAIDPQQVLSRQNQLDVANQLFAQGVHGAAADAYDAFIKTYPKYEQLEQVQLMLGILYARYLNRPDLARQRLSEALPRLHNQRQIELAREELGKVGGEVTS